MANTEAKRPDGDDPSLLPVIDPFVARESARRTVERAKDDDTASGSPPG